MSTTAELELLIELKAEGEDVLKDIGGQIEGIGEAAEGADGQTGGFFSNMLSSAGGFLAAGALSGIAGGLMDIAGGAMAAEEVQAKLNQALATTGRNSGMTADQINDLATQFQGLTKFEDDAIVAGSTVLLQFENLGAGVLPGATEAMLNLSTVMGKDTEASAKILGKALNDPINGLTDLEKVGVVFSESQKAMIVSMQESGDMAGAQALMLAELESKFGGAATAAGSTLSGQITIAKNTLMGFGEDIMGSFLPILADGLTGAVNFLSTTVLPALSSAWVSIKATIDQVLPPIQAIVMEIFGAIQTFFAEHGPAIEAFIQTAWENISKIIEGVILILQATIFPAFEAIAGFIMEHRDIIVPIIEATWGMIKNTVETVLGVIQGLIDFVLSVIKGDWEGAWAAIQDIVTVVWEGIQGAVEGALSIITGLLDLAWQAIRGTVEGAWNGIRDFFSGWWTNLERGFDTVISNVSGALDTAWQTIRGAAENAWNGIVGSIKGIFGSVVNGLKGPINQIIRALNAVIEGANAVGEALGLGTIGTIGYLAKGTSGWRGGLAVVGEQGPELARFPGGGMALLGAGLYNLPRGTEVDSASASRRALNGGARRGASTITNHFTIVQQPGESQGALAQRILDEQARRQRLADASYGG